MPNKNRAIMLINIYKALWFKIHKFQQDQYAVTVNLLMLLHQPSQSKHQQNIGKKKTHLEFPF